MALKIKGGDILPLLMKICLAVSFYNYLLRSSPESDITLYRIFQPIQVVLLLAMSKRRFLNWVATVLSLVVFGFFSITLSGYPFSVQYNGIFFMHYCSIFLIFFSAYAYVEKYGREDLEKFLMVNILFFFLLGAIEFIFGFHLSEGREGVVRGMMLNENDFSLVLASGAVYFLFRGDGIFFRYSSLVLALFFLFVNGSRIVSIMLLLSIAVYYYLYVANMSSKRDRAIAILMMILAPFSLFLFYSEEVLALSLMGESLGALIIDPIYRIVTLTDYGFGVGSLFVRVDATIFALRDFILSFGIGTGFGNTLQMLELGRYGYLIGLASIHNFPLQILVELGVFFVCGFLYFFLRHADRESLSLTALLLMLSLAQSAGVFSNFFFLLILSLSAVGYRGRR